MVNGRITAEQMEWLLARAEKLGGNLSAALRQTITDAQLLEMARDDYKQLRAEHPEFSIPLHDGEEATSRAVAVVLSWPMSDSDDMALRDQEARDEN